MAVASITSNNIGRSFDLEALQTVNQQSLSLFPLELTISGGNVTRRLTGLQKLVQRYALLFLNAKGTVRYAQTQGTNFMPAVTGGYVQSGEHVTHQFIFANTTVLDQLRFDDSNPAFGPTPPNDERIGVASLVDYLVDRQNASLFLSISITNLDGDNTVFVLPTK